MTTARLVPVTVEMDGDELDAEDAWHLARRFGLRRIAVDSFVRFRYGDGFTNSRALAIQTCLAVLPFLLALTGLAADIDEERPAQVVARTIEARLPRAARPGTRSRARSSGSESSESAGELALVLGLLLALVSMTAAMGQVERGSNRIYGIRRDRPARVEVRPGRRAHRRPGRARSARASCCWWPAARSPTPWPSSTAGPTTSSWPSGSRAGRSGTVLLVARDRGRARPRAAAAAARALVAGPRRRVSRCCSACRRPGCWRRTST